MFTRPEGMDAFVNLRPSMLDDRSWFVPYIETYTVEKLPWATPAPALRFAHAAEIDRELKAQEIPSAAVALFQAGEGVLTLGYGQRTPEGGAVTPQTVFRLGSVTQVLTGMALLQLRDAGRLTLDDPVALYIPELAAVLSPRPVTGDGALPGDPSLGHSERGPATRRLHSQRPRTHRGGAVGGGGTGWPRGVEGDA
ncbi:serine hydrolase domain-containing protein [Hyalangium sp.]|uniref:serine hydrolase domain-containing protein n=1 Tax=Hyalangium sp. TaxID=2028555 RepID=UPI002D23FCCB|nr:serine hydrolase domain-containing protein [Hyalangium sp.]HYI01679.1 serine hydrolase domain-containing protein [Hyalangium sp.]